MTEETNNDNKNNSTIMATYESLEGTPPPSLFDGSESGVGGPWACLEWPFRPPSALTTNRAATAQAMDSVAKGVMHASAAFFGPALLQLALNQVQEQQADCNDDDDDNNGACATNAALLFGYWSPNSVLTTSSVIAVLIATIGLPFLGAYIDRQRYDTTVDHGRYTAGKLTAYILAAIHLWQMFISTKTWFIFWISHTIAEALNMIHQMCVLLRSPNMTVLRLPCALTQHCRAVYRIILAYLQDLTPDVPTLTRYTSHFALLQFLGMLVFYTAVAVYARNAKAVSGDEDFAIVHTSRFANGVAGIFGLVVMGYAWAFLFSRRKEDHHFPGSLAGAARTWCEDFYLSWQSLARLVRLIRRNYPALQWLGVTLLFSPCVGSGSYFSIFSTLHKVLVGMDSAQIGLANLLALVSAVIGSRIAAYLGRKINALLSFQLSIMCLMASFSVTSCFVHGPEDITIYFGCMASLGLVLGWILTTERVLFCTLAPSENQAEMMGLLVSVHTALAFMPPLLFSVITQMGFSLNVAVMLQNVLLAMSLLASTMIGPFDRAVAQARQPPASETSA